MFFLPMFSQAELDGDVWLATTEANHDRLAQRSLSAYNGRVWVVRVRAFGAEHSITVAKGEQRNMTDMQVCLMSAAMTNQHSITAGSSIANEEGLSSPVFGAILDSEDDSSVWDSQSTSR